MLGTLFSLQITKCKLIIYRHTIFLVPSHLLMQCWKRRFRSFLGYKTEDVSRPQKTMSSLIQWPGTILPINFIKSNLMPTLIKYLSEIRLYRKQNSFEISVWFLSKIMVNSLSFDDISSYQSLRKLLTIRYFWSCW